jgi:hypothetical protein
MAIIGGFSPFPKRPTTCEDLQNIMKYHDLAEKIEQAIPKADTLDVAQLALLMFDQVDQLNQLEDSKKFADLMQECQLRLNSIGDQYQAVIKELDELGHSDPDKFEMKQIWVLIRAIEVQSQLLHSYAGIPTLDV